MSEPQTRFRSNTTALLSKLTSKSLGNRSHVGYRPIHTGKLSGEQRSFPSTRRALVCFIKEDCPTCRLVLPVLGAIHDSLASELDFFIVGQSRGGNSRLISEFTPPFHLLDDSALKVSFTNDIEIVPQVFLTNSEGQVLVERTGFVREEWQEMVAELLEQYPSAERTVEWDLPQAGAPVVVRFQSIRYMRSGLGLKPKTVR